METGAIHVCSHHNILCCASLVSIQWSLSIESNPMMTRSSKSGRPTLCPKHTTDTCFKCWIYNGSINYSYLTCIMWALDGLRCWVSCRHGFELLPHCHCLTVHDATQFSLWHILKSYKGHMIANSNLSVHCALVLHYSEIFMLSNHNIGLVWLLTLLSHYTS